MKSLKEYLKEGSKPKKILAPQDSAKEELWNSRKDRWSRNAKHPLRVNEVLSESEEPINEISTDTLKSYVAKAKPTAAGYGNPTPSEKDFQRSKGVSNAISIIKDRENPITDPKVHDLRKMDDREVYDITQTDDNIKDGDVLLLSNGRAGLLMKAWPMMVVGNSKQLHEIDPKYDWDSLERGRYAKSAEIAKQKASEVAETEEPEMEDADAITEGVMGGLKPLNPISRMMQLAGIAVNSILSPVSENETPAEEPINEDDTGMFAQLVKQQENGEFKDNPAGAKLAALGQILAGTKDIVNELKSQSPGTVKPDLMTKLDALDALGAMLINEARNIKKGQ